jgi:hypothetical protein
MGKISKNILPNGIVRNYKYDKFSRLTNLVSVKNEIIIDNRNYEYDLKGNKTLKIENGKSTLYRYDKINQLIEETKNIPPSLTLEKEINNDNNQITKYFYDTIGNRVRVEDWDNNKNPDITDYIYDKSEHLKIISGKRTNIFSEKEYLPEGIQMDYDKRGNLIKAKSGERIIAELLFDETNKLKNFNGKDNIKYSMEK